MAIIVHSTHNLHFGLGFPPNLIPTNWTLIESREEFTTAKAPSGQTYYLSPTHAFPVLESDPPERFRRVDFRNPIALQA